MQKRGIIEKNRSTSLEKQAIDRVPWTIQQTFLGTCFTLVPYLLFVLSLRIIGGGGGEETVTSPLSFRADVVNAIALLLTTIIINGCFLFAPYYFARSAEPPVQGRNLRQILERLGFHRFQWGSSLLLIGGFFLAIILLNVAYDWFLTTFNIPLSTNDQSVLNQGKVAPVTMYVTLLGAVLVAPFFEEIFFRAFLFMGLLRGMSVPLAIIISSVIFGLTHFDVGSFPVLLGIGLALAFLRWRSKSIWPSILLHALNNGAGAVAILLTFHGIW